MVQSTCMALHHNWIQVLCRVPEALGKGLIALGKAFAECGTRQRTHGKKLIGKDLFAECLLSGTRKRKATVTAPAPLTVALPSANPAGTRQRFFIFFKKNFFAECQPFRHSAKLFYFFKKFLCRVPTIQTLGKVFLFFLKKFFAECQPSGTRQTFFIFFKKISLPSVNPEGTRQRFFIFFKFLCRVPYGWHSEKF